MDARELEAIGRRPLRYWNEDGIPDLMGGAMLVVLAVMNWGMYAENPFLVAAMVPFPLVIALFGQKAVRKVKERIVFPRTGAIVPRQPVSRYRWLATTGLFLAMAGVVAFMVQHPAAFYAWLTPVAGASFTVGWVEGWRRLRLGRYLLLALVTAATTAGLMVSGSQDQRDLIVFMAVTGVATLASGGYALARFLHTAPPAPQE